ncbi:hypothetical protein SCP_0406820 [Sparassis crispa]|uniref:Uncharacterized protein n=1 Tax=Sparassis crispa TaxID=139825 RepID=A0A401GJF3_9APHY|nr:hypothetical protein SCP_0406820 [Sparassis crispa]GBE82298.1 hypothetical protein SCP_0406820 [Sparassis crispa]
MPSRTPSPFPEPILEPLPQLDNHPGGDYRKVKLPSVGTPGLDRDQDELPHISIPAFNEESCIRMAYLHAVMGNTFENLTWKAATQQLNRSLDCLDAQAGELPINPQPARTLATARQRLGIDPDAWIIQYAICPVCWKHHTLNELKELASPDCTVPGCSGKIYVEVLDSSGRTRRDPIKINPQVSIVESIRRMMMHPGFARSLCDFCSHQAGRNNDEDYQMEDIYDGDMLFKLQTGTVWEVNSMGTVRDRLCENGANATKLVSHRYGLALSMNLDWFGLLSG